MKSRMLSTAWRLAAVLCVLSSSVGAADAARNASTPRTDDSNNFLTDLLTLDSILPAGIVVVLALVVIARKRKVH